MSQFSSAKQMFGLAPFSLIFALSLMITLHWNPRHAWANVVFTNRAAWEASLTGKTIQTETFNQFTGFTYETGVGKAFQFPSGVTNIGKLSFDVDRPSGNLIVEGTFFSSVDSTTFWRIETSTQNGSTPPVTPALVFSQDIYAFGADWNFAFAPRSKMIVAGNTFLFSDNLNAGKSFFGVSSSTPFRRVEFDVVSPFNDLFHADNISFAQSVPEPSSMTFILVFLANALFMRSRISIGSIKRRFGAVIV